MTSESKAASIRPLSRPTTPLRPSSRSSIRSSNFAHCAAAADGAADPTATTTTNNDYNISQPAIFALQSQFSELADSIADLEANFMHLQLMHESLSRFNENFSSFLYGLNMNAFSVDFPEGPIPLSFKQAKEREAAGSASSAAQSTPQDNDVDDSTFLTTDTSFVDHPQQPPSNTTSTQPKSTSSTTSSRTRGSTRGTTRGRGTVSGTRTSRHPTTSTRGTTTSSATRANTRRVR